MPTEMRRPLLVAMAAVLLAAAGVALLAGAGGDTRRTHVVVDRVPMDEVHPAGAARHPGVVVAHGFAGSAELMAPFGDTLAARGYVVVLLDFSGHGANTRPMRDDDGAGRQRDLDVAVAHLRSLPDVDPARISLVGHSMGAGAVTRYAAAHDDIAGTVAISLPDASDLPPSRPVRLLTLVGGLEFPAFRTAAERAAAEETGRSEVVPGADHVSILFSPTAHRETADWLDQATGGPLPAPMRRAGGAALLLVALAAGLVPVARLLLGPGRRRWPRFEWRAVAVTAGAAAVAAVAARFLPTDDLPLRLGGYVAGLTGVTGALLLAYTSRRPAVEEAAPRRPAAPLLILYAAISIAVPLQLGLTHVVPVGPRWWLLPVVWAGFLLLGYAVERAGGNALTLLAVSALTVVALVAAAVVGLTSTFVLLVAPLLAVLMVGQAVWSAVLHRFGAPRWVIAAAGSLLVAWPIATTLPLVSS
ncbi:hypothetical protein GCM10010172_57410 [Paractinoplanes ferrugineus]|uniref:Serine aminopeptidase S33 domain-containing protein n=1 Tax=Paractinoplanes ferrugineus TaxID=113564 RepID=A0A919MDP0_9ACTN|nr:alpha/beta fold hydrolase [Actinoplanes ferrugineus]GIE10789.1 hypothetical protein Afe05nite_26290 [Actinoplanes ferrugineus]